MPKMADFKHILVAVDFGESSDQATDLAMQLAAKFGSALTLVHTYEIPSYAYPNASFLVVDLLAPIEEAARKQLDKALVDVQGRFPGAKAVLRHGAPAAEILATIEEVHADFLCGRDPRPSRYQPYAPRKRRRKIGPHVPGAGAHGPASTDGRDEIGLLRLILKRRPGRRRRRLEAPPCISGDDEPSFQLQRGGQHAVFGGEFVDRKGKRPRPLEASEIEAPFLDLAPDKADHPLVARRVAKLEPDLRRAMDAGEIDDDERDVEGLCRRRK